MPRKAKAARTRRRGRPGALAVIPTTALQHELERRMGMLESLIRARDEMSAKLDTLNSEIAQLHPSAGSRSGAARRGPGRPRGSKGLPSRRRGRPRNPHNLVESLRKVLNGKTHSVTDLVGVVQDAGYKTTSPNFRTIVNQALIANPKLFKRVARGQYTAH